MTKEDYALLDKYGLCHGCQKAKAFPNRKFCPECLELFANRNAARYANLTPEQKKADLEKRKERRHRYKAEGRCPRCGKPATHGMYCYEHSLRAKRHARKWNETVKEARYKAKEHSFEYKKEHHLCRVCGSPIEEGNATSWCNACREKQAERARIQRVQMKAEGRVYDFKFGRALYGQRTNRSTGQGG